MSFCIQHTAATLSDLKTCSQQDADERFERVLSSSLAALAAFIDSVFSADQPVSSQSQADFAFVCSDRVLKLAASEMFDASEISSWNLLWQFVL